MLKYEREIEELLCELESQEPASRRRADQWQSPQVVRPPLQALLYRLLSVTLLVRLVGPAIGIGLILVSAWLPEAIRVPLTVLAVLLFLAAATHLLDDLLIGEASSENAIETVKQREGLDGPGAPR
ncbi:MAG: hypothetical protein M3Q29_00960 [Chloroflexota bacterium]|nr:hypothetical protein [Chloroflexota bacterium]